MSAENARLRHALREQYDLAHSQDAQSHQEGESDEDGCDDRCRRARALLADTKGGDRE